MPLTLPPMLFRLHLLAPLSVALLGCTLAGCEGRESISTYTVPKEESVQPAQTERMLAAMVPHENQAWFFKVTGPDEAVRGIGQSFREFVGSVRFAPDQGGRPQWDLPADWSLEEGSGMRFATIAIPTAEKPLEMTVIPLPMTEGDTPQYRLSNVNRWRSQLGLPPIEESALEDSTEQISLESGSGILVELVGKSSGGGPPFAAMAGTPPIQRADPGQPPPGASDLLTYDVPVGWKPGRTDRMRKAAFEVAESDRKVEITAIDLAASAGEDVVGNVNRWRGQVGLPELTEQQMAEELAAMTIGGEPGTYVELPGPSGETILGAIVVHEDRGWFFKLTGDSELAERERERFRQFLDSVRFGAE